MKKLFIPIIALACLCSFAGNAFAFDTGADTQELWLINSEHTIDKNYKADDLTLLADSIPQNGSQQMRKQAAEAFKLLSEGVRAAGYNKIAARSGYRSFSTQNVLFTNRVAERQKQGMSYKQAYAATLLYTAFPGTSEHQTGLSMDISTSSNTLNNNFGNTEAGKWLDKNSWRYGFILRYTEDKQNYTKIASEPWHFRFVGFPHAQIIYEKGWCYEEYINYLQQNGSLSFESNDDYIYEIYWTADSTKEYENILNISSDNAGGWIITTRHPIDMFSKIHGSWAEQSFTALIKDKDFKYPHVIDPAAAISRADFGMLYDLLGEYLYGNNKTTSSFTGYYDVPTIAYYYDAINRLAKAGIMVGSNNIFNPNNNITREATATAIANVIADETVRLICYSDIASIAGWAFQSVQKVTYHNLMIGTENGFNPKGNLTWGEAATIIYRLKLYLAQNQPLTDKLPTTEELQTANQLETILKTYKTAAIKQTDTQNTYTNTRQFELREKDNIKLHIIDNNGTLPTLSADGVVYTYGKDKNTYAHIYAAATDSHMTFSDYNLFKLSSTEQVKFIKEQDEMILVQSEYALDKNTVKAYTNWKAQIGDIAQNNYYFDSATLLLNKIEFVINGQTVAQNEYSYGTAIERFDVQLNFLTATMNTVTIDKNGVQHQYIVPNQSLFTCTTDEGYNFYLDASYNNPAFTQENNYYLKCFEDITLYIK